jgi:hypothetical protein
MGELNDRCEGISTSDPTVYRGDWMIQNIWWVERKERQEAGFNTALSAERCYIIQVA